MQFDGASKQANNVLNARIAAFYSVAATLLLVHPIALCGSKIG